MLFGVGLLRHLMVTMRLSVKRRTSAASMPDGTPKVAIVVGHPAQHFAPAYRLLEQDRRLAFRAFFWRADVSDVLDPGFNRPVRWDVDLRRGYTWSAPRYRNLRGLWQLSRALAAYAPDAVLCFGWTSPAARLGLLWSIATRTTVFVYGDSTWQGRRPFPAALVRALVLRLLFKFVTGAVSTGTFNREFYIRHGMHPSRILRGIYPADVDFYRQHADREAARAEHVIADGAFVIGYAGKLIPRKGVQDLLRAAAMLPKQLAWELVIIGDGPDRPHLEHLAEEINLDGRVRFLGFQNQSAMPRLLSMCDVIVVPSTYDMRVLIAVEAMACGVPVVVSTGTAVWGAGDLIDHGRTGFTYPSGDTAALAARLQRLMGDPELKECLGKAGAAVARQQSPEVFCSLLIDAFAGRRELDRW